MRWFALWNNMGCTVAVAFSVPVTYARRSDVGLLLNCVRWSLVAHLADWLFLICLVLSPISAHQILSQKLAL
jgi:hypothetical protein